MSSSDYVSPFDGLPHEMICYIFNYLDLNSLKSVSLTCQRLERIFSSYCSGRFMLYMGIDRYRFIPYKHDREWPVDGSVESIAKMLKNSTRYYQKVHLPVHFERLNSNQSMYSVLDSLLGTVWLRQLVVLELEMATDSHDYVTQINAAVTKMDQLQELKLLHTKFSPFGERFKELKIENGTLQRLVLEIALPSVINCPKLRKLDVASHLDAETHFGKQYAQYGDQEPYWKLKQLEEFTITLHNNTYPQGCKEHRPGYKFQFYQQLKQLRKLHIYATPVSEKFLQSICESCVHLEDLFISSWQAIDSNSLRCLSNLPDLRRLGIWQNTTPQPVSFASVKAPKLEHLTLGSMCIVWESLEQFQSIKSLNLTPPLDVTPIPLSFAKLTKQLEFLWLDFRCVLDPMTIIPVFQELPFLKTLILENLDFRKATARCMLSSTLPPLLQLNRLVLYVCPGKQDVTLDARRFPNVKRIEQEIPKCFPCNFKQRLYAQRVSVSLHFKNGRIAIRQY